MIFLFCFCCLFWDWEILGQCTVSGKQGILSNIITAWVFFWLTDGQSVLLCKCDGVQICVSWCGAKDESLSLLQILVVFEFLVILSLCMWLCGHQALKENITLSLWLVIFCSKLVIIVLGVKYTLDKALSLCVVIGSAVEWLLQEVLQK